MLDTIWGNYIEPTNEANDYDYMQDYNLTPDDFSNFLEPGHWEKVNSFVYEMWNLVIVKKDYILVIRSQIEYDQSCN